MEHLTNLTITDFLNPILLAIVALFLRRLLKQFDELLLKVEQLNSTLQDHKKDVSVALTEHKTDVALITEKINGHTREIQEINILWDRIRVVENDITSIKARQYSN